MTLVGLTVLVVGCSVTGGPGASPEEGSRSESPIAPVDASGQPNGGAESAEPLPSAPPPPAPVTLSEAEVYPNAKRLAATVAQRLTTYDVGTSAAEVATAVVGDGAASLEQFITVATPLHRDDTWSRGKVVYPQLGGVSPDRASVMVVVEQTVGVPGGTRTETRTLDIRLRLAGDEWAFDGLASAGGEPPTDPPPPSDEAEAVLSDDRIDLPDSARWDILSGGTDPDLLRLMLRIADRTPYSVVALSSGHPFEVFGTERQSNHSKGRAVDIYRVGDRDVIDDRSDGSPTNELVAWLFEDGAVAELGSPWALDGFGGRSFTDVVHADHLHVGVDGDGESDVSSG